MAGRCRGRRRPQPPWSRAGASTRIPAVGAGAVAGAGRSRAWRSSGRAGSGAPSADGSDRLRPPSPLEPRRRPGERRAVPAVRRGRQRQGPRRPHGHQGAPGDRCQRVAALDTGHEGGLPAARGGCRPRRGGAAAAPTPAWSGGLQGSTSSWPRSSHRRAPSACKGPQATRPLHGGWLHRRGLRGLGRRTLHAHRRHRGGGPDAVVAAVRGVGPGRLRQRRLPRRPGRPARSTRPHATPSSTSARTR